MHNAPTTILQAKIAKLKRNLKTTTSATEYRQLLARIAGLSGSRATKQSAGRKGGHARARNHGRAKKA